MTIRRFPSGTDADYLMEQLRLNLPNSDWSFCNEGRVCFKVSSEGSAYADLDKLLTDLNIPFEQGE